MILAIKNYNIALHKVAAIAVQEENTLVYTTADDTPFSFPDLDGTIYSAAMARWREWLQNRYNDWRASVEYATQIATEKAA